MSPTRVCLVTDELYPFTAGGIGRITHNLILDSLRRDADVELHVLFPDSVKVPPSQVEMFFGGRVKAHVCPPREPHQSTADAHGVYPPRAAFLDSRWHGESLDLMRYLKAREAEGLHFDVIEFTDFHGWAFCTLQEKHLGLAFTQATISVRLHSSYGVLMRLEPNTLEVENLGRYEIERKALLDADVVVAHLPCIADFNRRFYGFDEAWARKVTVEFPPVVMDAPPRLPALDIAPTQRNLVFVTKIQSFKQPDVFIRAAVLLMRAWPEYQGRAVLACHSFDPDYLREVKALVPADLTDRFVFIKPGPDREALMRTGVVVIPSIFESLNLTAYEVSVAGSRLVLNGACLAFGEDSPFVDGANCYKYDGSLDGLAEAMRRALEGPELDAVTWTVARPYWETRRPPTVVSATPARHPLVSVVITNQDRGRYLSEALHGLAATTYPELEVIIVDDASTAPFDVQVLGRVERSAAEAGSYLRVIRSPVRRGLAGARNLGLRAARGEYVLSLDSDGCVSPGFIERAVTALEARAEYSGVVPTTGCFQSGEELNVRQFSDFITFLGDCPSYALVANRVSSPSVLLRRSALASYTYNEGLLGYEDWELLLRMVHGGHRLLVTNQVHFFSRRRPEAPVTEAERRRHFQGIVRMLENLPEPLSPGVRLFTLLAHSRDAMVDPQGAVHPVVKVSPPAPVEVPPPLDRPLRYDVVDFMNAALKRLPLVHPLLKHAAGAAVPGDEAGAAESHQPAPLRYTVVDQVNGLLKRAPFLHHALRRTAGKVI
jgi:glycosyltransferase involved in cell wall biosynthesis